MKIAFWLNNSGIKNVDCSRITEGNPGIGGTEFSAILIAESLHLVGEETILLCNESGNFSKKQQFHVCYDIAEACRFVERNNYDFFILDSRDITERILITFPNIKFIAWANCFIESWMNEVFPKYSNLVKFVNVGRLQYKLCANMPIASKATYIYNAVPFTILSEVRPKTFSQRGFNVVYIGSLHYAKGFHLLARAWPKILEKVPEAKLYVIGSGKLYSRNSKLGKWGIAQESYEDEFMKYLAPNGKLMPSVRFLGVLGKEKYKVLSECRVGVPNPSGISETFGYTAVEMQVMGCRVTTIECPAYVDTVYNKKNLYSNPDDIASYVARLLLDEKLDDNVNIQNFIKQFSVDKIVSEWKSLLIGVLKDSTVRLILEKRSFIGYVYYFNDIAKYYKHKLKKIIVKILRIE